MAHGIFSKTARIAVVALAFVAVVAPKDGRADPLLDEIVEFTGQIYFIDTKVPAVVIGAVRGGEMSVKGFGERAGPGSPAPDGDTVLRIGSITKAFTGLMLAHLTANGTVEMAQPMTQWLPNMGPGVNGDAQRIRLIDLATHAAGFPREVPHEPGPDDDPFGTITPDTFASWIKKEPLLFAPGSSVLYSNFGFDLLAMALSAAAKKPYPELLQEHVTAPLGMKDTGFTLSDEQQKRFMQGQAPDGTPMPIVPTGPVIVGSGGLYSTPNDLLRWMKWHLDRFGTNGAEARVLDHGLYVMRDGLKTVSGMDESGHMDGLGLAWIGMMAKDDQPFILQKAGGLQGTFTYIAFAPTRNAAVFIAINKFDFAAAFAMGKFANELLATIAPR
ncbi:MAG: D-alanyl-D-alanine-carboxypeptidase/endopeptidase AmpH [Methyloceanibacter sp.]